MKSNFFGSKCKTFYSFKLKKNTKTKILKLNIFIVWKNIMRFHVDCRPRSRQPNESLLWGSCLYFKLISKMNCRLLADEKTYSKYSARK